MTTARLPIIQRTKDRSLMHIDARCFQWHGYWEEIEPDNFKQLVKGLKLETWDVKGVKWKNG